MHILVISVQGVVQGSASLITQREQFIRLWAHECQRVFHDRLVDDDDRKWFEHMLVEKVLRRRNDATLVS